AQGIRFVEADFLLSKDDAIIAAHHSNLGGDCGRVSRRTLEQLRECRLSGDRRVATLEDLLALPFEAIYIDLKESSARSSKDLLDVVTRNIVAIEEAERKESAVLMLYDINDEVADLIRERGIRAGLKGYPGGAEGVPAMIDTAARYELEMMCINATNLTPDLVRESARRGIWHLTWDHAREANIPHWQELIKAGIGGIIVDTDAIVPQSAIDQWQDIRAQID
ncbi:MAG: glycerophosphodiester phosphodiesterase, partial [Bradymonadaceae bacterium]